jgi:hypothetical protein
MTPLNIPSYREENVNQIIEMYRLILTFEKFCKTICVKQVSYNWVDINTNVHLSLCEEKCSDRIIDSLEDIIDE